MLGLFDSLPVSGGMMRLQEGQVDRRELVVLETRCCICPQCPSIMQKAEIPYGPAAGVYFVCPCCNHIEHFTGEPKLPFDRVQ